MKNKNYDYLRQDITKIKHYGLTMNVQPESSNETREIFYYAYKNIKWDFLDSFSFLGEDVPIKSGYAVKLKSKSKFAELLGSNTLFSGIKDFDFTELPQNIYDQSQSLEESRHLRDAWEEFDGRQNSYLNMSFMPVFEDIDKSKYSIMPLFLYNLNRYYVNGSEELFSSYNNLDKKIMKLYLNSAFERSNSWNQNVMIEDYCSKALFIEDPQIVCALLEYGRRIQEKIDQGKPVFDNIDDVYKLIYLATWYWSEKEVNMLVMSDGHL